MSLFNTTYPNTIAIRAGKAMCEELYTVNPLTEQMERVLPGGGGEEPVTLPYYLKSNSVEINKGTGTTTKHLGDSVIIAPTDTEVSGLSSHLTSAALTIGKSVAGSSGLIDSEQPRTIVSNTGVTIADGVDTPEVLNKAKVKDLTAFNQKTSVATPTATQKMLLFDTSNSTYKYSDVPSTVSLPEYLKTNSVEINYGTGITTKHLGDSVVVAPTDVAVSGLTSRLSNANLTVGYTVAGYPGSIDASRPRGIVSSTHVRSYNNSTTYTELNPTGMSITNGVGAPAVLTKARLADLMALASKTTVVTPTATQKMLLFDTSDSSYKYSDIPSTVTLPTYLQTSKIVMPDGADKINTMEPSHIEVKDLSGFYGPLKAVLTHDNLKIGTQHPDFANSFDETRALAQVGSEYVRLRNYGNTKSSSLTPTHLGFTDAGESLLLTHPRLKDLIAFGDKASVATPGVAQKMLLWDSTDSSYKYTDIPVETILPSYIKTDNIFMDGVEFAHGKVYMSGGKTEHEAVVRVSGGGSTPPTTALVYNGVKFHPAGATFANDLILTHQDVKRIKEGPNVYNVTIPYRIANTDGSPVGSYDGGTNTLSYSIGEHGDFGAMIRITSPLKVGDVIKLSFSSTRPLTSGTVYYIPFMINSPTAYQSYTVINNSGISFPIIGSTTFSGTTRSNCGIIAIRPTGNTTTNNLKMDLVVENLDRSFTAGTTELA